MFEPVMPDSKSSSVWEIKTGINVEKKADKKIKKAEKKK